MVIVILMLVIFALTLENNKSTLFTLKERKCSPPQTYNAHFSFNKYYRKAAAHSEGQMFKIEKHMKQKNLWYQTHYTKQYLLPPWPSRYVS